MLALIDADILIYEAAHRSQFADEWDEGEFAFSASLPNAQADFAGCIEKIMKAVGATDSVLALTDSDRNANFRRGIYAPYKNKRSKASNHRPLLYSALRQWCRETYNVNQKHGIEADDTLGILATADLASLPPKDERVICSIDKDLDTVPGLHYNWRKSENGVYIVGTEDAFYWFMYQTLIGDATDNYPGVKGVGPKGAERLLQPIRDLTVAELEEAFPGLSHREARERLMWKTTVETFEKKGETEEAALVQARCARILHASDWDFQGGCPILWTPEGVK